MLSKILPNVIASFFLAIVVVLAIVFYFNPLDISEENGYLTFFIISFLGVIFAIGSFAVIFFYNRKVDGYGHSPIDGRDFDDEGGDITGGDETERRRFLQRNNMRTPERLSPQTRFNTPRNQMGVNYSEPLTGRVPKPADGYDQTPGPVYLESSTPPTQTRMDPPRYYDDNESLDTSLFEEYDSELPSFPETSDSRAEYRM